MAYDINLIADYVIWTMNQNRDEVISLRKLNRLLYFIQKHHYQRHKQPLFDGEFQAWVHGPMNVEIFKRFWTSIYGSVYCPNFDEASISEDAKHHIEFVLYSYGEYSDNQLDVLCREEESWRKAREGYDPAEKCEVEMKFVQEAWYKFILGTPGRYIRVLIGTLVLIALLFLFAPNISMTEFIFCYYISILVGEIVTGEMDQ